MSHNIGGHSPTNAPGAPRSALALVVGLRPDPKAHAQKDGRHGQKMEMPTSHTRAMDQIDQHDFLIPDLAGANRSAG